MNRFLRFVCTTSFCVASLLAMPARATIVSGYFNDAGNTALISSNGFDDLEAAQFSSDDAVVRNVAIYALNVTAPWTVQFASSGYAAGGAQP
jgi:hypothetical protein